MQILEDNIEDYGDIPKRIQALRSKVQELLENRPNKISSVVSSEKNEELVREIVMLKKQLAEREQTILENKTTLQPTVTVDSEKNEVYEKEILALNKQLEEKENEILENKPNLEAGGNAEVNEDLAQENMLLKKQLDDREKTIKELDFKLEMFKLAKTLREGSGIGSKSEELKQMITEYIKEIDKSITSLNIE